MQQVKSIIDKNEKEIVKDCQNYLYEYEQGKGSSMSSDIDEILSWIT